MIRLITLYTTLGKLVKIDSDAVTWGDLSPAVRAEGIDTDEMKATENLNKSVLDSNASILPTGPFTIFFTKKNSKAGALDPLSCSYKELRAELSSIMAKDPSTKDFFNQDGVNYTRKPQEELRQLLADHYNSKEKVTEPVGNQIEPDSEDAPETTVSEVPDSEDVATRNVTAGEAIKALNAFLENRRDEGDADSDAADSALYNLKDYLEVTEEHDMSYVLSRELNLSVEDVQEKMDESREERIALEQEMARMNIRQ